MRKLGALAAAAAIAGVTLVAGAVPAQAAERSTQCETEGYSAQGFGRYTTQGSIQFWDDVVWSIRGGGLRNHNNTNIRLRATPDGSHSTSHVTYFSYDSPDSLVANKAYNVPIQKFVPASENIYLKFETFFDVAGDDPHCVMYTDYV